MKRSWEIVENVQIKYSRCMHFSVWTLQSFHYILTLQVSLAKSCITLYTDIVIIGDYITYRSSIIAFTVDYRSSSPYYTKEWHWRNCDTTVPFILASSFGLSRFQTQKYSCFDVSFTIMIFFGVMKLSDLNNMVVVCTRDGTFTRWSSIHLPFRFDSVNDICQWFGTATLILRGVFWRVRNL